MIAFVIRVLVLSGAMHGAYPRLPISRVVTASAVAAANETPQIRAELLLAISEHESDLEPSAVSWISSGHRIDRVRGEVPRGVPLTCGFLQAMLTREPCLEAIDRDGAMAAGVAELRTWLETCRGDLACAMRGHAGGTRCALVDECSPHARAFADLFLARARRLEHRCRNV